MLVIHMQCLWGPVWSVTAELASVGCRNMVWAECPELASEGAGSVFFSCRADDGCGAWTGLLLSFMQSMQRIYFYLHCPLAA